MRMDQASEGFVKGDKKFSRFQESNLGLGRMHVDVDLSGIHRQESASGWKFTREKSLSKWAQHRLLDQAIAQGSTIHELDQVSGMRQTHALNPVDFELESLACRTLGGEEWKILSFGNNHTNAVFFALRSEVEDLFGVGSELKSHLRVGKRQALHPFAYR
jgi:hypothetical protein